MYIYLVFQFCQDWDNRTFFWILWSKTNFRTMFFLNIWFILFCFFFYFRCTNNNFLTWRKLLSTKQCSQNLYIRKQITSLLEFFQKTRAGICKCFKICIKPQRELFVEKCKRSLRHTKILLCFLINFFDLKN